VNAYPSQSVLISFSPIYEPLRSLGYKPAQGSHADSILIEDVPVQFLVGNSLVDEAIDQAITVDLMGEPTEIVDLEYAIAVALDVSRAKSLSRIETLPETTIRPIETARLEVILARHMPARRGVFARPMDADQRGALAALPFAGKNAPDAPAASEHPGASGGETDR